MHNEVIFASAEYALDNHMCIGWAWLG